MSDGWEDFVPPTHFHAVPEGQECPTCRRRVPKKKKDTSPVTKVRGIRVPVGDVDDFVILEEETAKHLGVYEKSHWQFWTHQYALAWTLNSPEIRGALESGD